MAGVLLAFAVPLQGADQQRATIGMRLPDISHLDPRTQAFDNSSPLKISINGIHRPLGRLDPIAVTRHFELDATHSTISIREALYKLPFRMPYVASLETYKKARLAADRRWQWSKTASQAVYLRDADKRTGPGGLNVDIPVPIKSKAFQTIFGGSSVGLNVQGDIRIFGGFRNEDRSEVRTTNIRGSSTSFKMNQTQRFTVTGRIGEKVTVNVDQDSERAFDFDNNLKLNYTGYDDEIIQSIEAGNIALNLPATRFVTFAGKSSGLFGIKSNMQLGNLTLTAIASQEKGENKKLSLSGGQSEDSRRINDYEYRRFAYFFIDDIYRENFKFFTERWVHDASGSIPITDIEVYKSDANYETKFPQSIRGWAVVDPANADTISTGRESYFGNWIRLDPAVDYYVEKTLGFIVPTNPLNREEVLAVAYKTTQRTVGEIPYNPQSDGNILLKLIKPRNPLPSDSRTWKLEWKNVYYLGARNISREGFELKIYFKPAAGDPQESQPDAATGQARSYLNIFGLDETDVNGAPNPDNTIDIKDGIINLGRGELILPWLEPFDPDNPDGVFVGRAPQPSLLDISKRDGTMYDTTSTSFIAQRSKFFIEIKSKNRSATYNLGFNVIENSEEVRLDGALLRRDADYVIDYFSGSLTILNDRATLPTAQVDIAYQSNQLFQLEKKTILGTRADYRLGRESFIGGTVLYLNERTLDQRVRIGQGPMQNFIWDFNTSLKFTPTFLTKAIDALPFIRTSEPSSVAFEGEIAQIIPNPNTLNNPGTQDNDGVAYIDDFEAAKRITPLSVLRKGWVESSVPDSSELSLNNRGRLYWYNPYSQVPIREIKPKQDVNANVSQTTQVLELVLTPATTGDPRRSWGGIMRALSPGFFDQTESKFLEIWINGDSGRVHVDIGNISEDIIPNTKLDTEDKIRSGFRNQILDDDEDVGLDGMADNDSRAVAAGGDFWDLDGDGLKRVDEPYSDDNWFYQSESDNYERINGTENNRLDTGDTGTIRPDTEDLNGNGNVDRTNNYFEYSFDLKKPSADSVRYVRGGIGLDPDEDFGWRLYRIPLDDYRNKVGNPDRSQIEFVRLWVDGVDEPTLIRIAEISFAGNEWREVGITLVDSVGAVFQAPVDSTQASVSVAVVNTQDNPDYRPPDGVAGERDRVTQVIAKEQSLVLRARRLQPGNAGIAQKSFFSPLSFINYKRLRMFVYGRDDRGDLMKPDSSVIVFFLRFGADERNYYEFRTRVYPGWDKRNEMDIDMLEMTALKNVAMSQTYNALAGAVLKQSGGQEWRIRGEPSLTNVRLLIGGMTHAGAANAFDGEVWMNEFRASDVKKDKGMAMRGRAEIKLADFIQLSGDIERRDADFHNVAERLSPNQATSLSTRLNANIAFDRVLPQSLGLSVPITITYGSSNSLPKYIPGKDIETSVLPGFDQDKYRSLNDQQGFTISARRRVASKNWLMRYTIDNISASLSNAYNHTENSTTLYANRTTWVGNVNYALTFGRNNFVSPFWFMKGLPLLGKLGSSRLYYTPQNFDVKFQNNVASANSETRVASGSGVRTNVKTDVLNRDFHTNVKLFEPLTFDWTRNYTHDLSKVSDKLTELFTPSPGEETNLNQSFTAKYSPNFFNWLNNSINYSTTYRYQNNIEQRDSNVGRQASNNTNLTLSTTLRLSQLFKAAPGRRGRSTPEPPQQRPAPGRRDDEENGGEAAEPDERIERQPAEKEKEKQDPEAKKPPEEGPRRTPPSRQPATPSKTRDEEKGGVNILGALSGVMSKFKDIQFNYTKRTTVNHLGLRDDKKPTWRYQFGLDQEPEVGTVDGFATNARNFIRGQNYLAQTGLALGPSFGVEMRFAYDQQQNESTTTSGNNSISALGKGKPFPELTLNVGGLEKLSFFRKVATSVSFSSNFTPQYKTVWVNNSDNVTSEDNSISFRPLAKINVSWKNGMVTNVQYTSLEGLREALYPGIGITFSAGTKTTTSDLSITHTYSKRSGFRIPIWFLKNKELKNSIDLSITFTRSRSTTAARRGKELPFEEQDNTSRWSFEPKMTYSFSNRVRGGAHFTVGKSSSKRVGDTKIKELGIEVNISIRGN
jgi:cell surface protein SprA